MLHKEFWGLVFLGFVVWVFVMATSANDRMAHACRPVGWTGNVVTSVSALAIPDQQQTMQRWFDKLEYGCRYTAWRLFYQDEYNKWLESEKAKANPAAPASAATVSPAGASPTTAKQ
jgi:hypothetical protein